MPTTTPNSAQAALDKFATAVESGRLRSTLIELLDEEPFTRFEEWADSLTTIAENVGTARDAIDEWMNAEEREEKADARDRALEALDELVSACNNSPLDVTTLDDWTEEHEA